MDLEEWKSYHDLENPSEQAPIFSWLSLLSKKERRQFLIFHELTKILDHKKILELGSGQGHIGVFLNLAGYDVSLSDFDDSVLVNQIKDIDLKVKEVDFAKISHDLETYSCVIAVQLDYIFDEDKLKNFFKICSLSKTDIIFVNSQIFGPINYINYSIKQNNRSKHLKQHGYMKTLGFYKRLAKKNSMKFSFKRSKHDLIDGYYFLKFKNKKM